MDEHRRPGWHDVTGHRRWLLEEATRLLCFYLPRVLDPDGGFHELGVDGAPQVVEERSVVTTARMVHSFSLAHLLGYPGAGPLADHGLRFLQSHHRDRTHGGYDWIAGRDGPIDASKTAYGHAHVLLAASSALAADRPGAPELMASIGEIIDERFWSDAEGRSVEEYGADWTGPSPYRGQNSNMHLTEALMAAYEVTGERRHLERARSIARHLIQEAAAENGWRVPEHYDQEWRMDREYHRDEPEHPYRPYGTTVGHSLEWARLLLQLRALLGDNERWMLDASRQLFQRAVDDGWVADRGGFVYTLDYDGRPLKCDRFWWVMAEAIGAASFLLRVTKDLAYERWYRTFWDWTELHLIDRERGGWFSVLDPELRLKERPWGGKNDLYHALQACLVPLLPTDHGLAVGLRSGLLRLEPAAS